LFVACNNNRGADGRIARKELFATPVQLNNLPSIPWRGNHLVRMGMATVVRRLERST
jgi:hypothetical protein